MTTYNKEKADKIIKMIHAAHRKIEVIQDSPYYKIFGTEKQRFEDLIFMNHVIVRLQNYYLNQFCKHLNVK